MNKGLDLIQRQQIEVIDGYPTGNVYVGLTTEELAELEKELEDGEKYKKAIEILKGKGTYMVEIISAVCYYKTYDELLGDTCPWCSNRDLNREEFDLLKEVFE